MQDITIRQSGRKTFYIERSDQDAISATFLFSDGTTTKSITEPFDSAGRAYFELGSPLTDVAGEYEYQVNENFASGSPSIWPDPDNCDGDCDLPRLTICEALPSETS